MKTFIFLLCFIASSAMAENYVYDVSSSNIGSDEFVYGEVSSEKDSEYVTGYVVTNNGEVVDVNGEFTDMGQIDVEGVNYDGEIVTYELFVEE